ncbi:SDR family NAD(P)-dependent oxidoreductase [Sulfitobacter sp. D35]|uniref:SDR family NAD(P)-dependent oxidoreductase n=1 Tax=Sulfitobacter sp. D35 TaxID=3083252 RepID=UPI00296E31F3|nr:SDR family NAD(P)-dependent oxidoreductase [Sulfitobacter sp. D35]MDW4498053.1 SDR family NAD(P)-dependent oxidoreductase [Sulfitobacter sp. D35]
MDFESRTVVVTGGASGIGAALARRFAKAGARVCIADHDAAGARAVAGEIGGLGVTCDVTREEAVRSLVDEVRTKLGPVDIFVSNAGVARGQPGHAVSADDDVWTLNWRLHVMAHVYAARALLPEMIARRSGHLVSVASAAGLLNQIGDAAYSATKHAAVSFAESLAISHGDDGIDVSVVCPQYVATPLIGLASGDADDVPGLLTAEEAAAVIVEGVAKKRFLILPHPQVADYAALRARDPEAWIAGMRKLRRRTAAADGSLDAAALYRLV